MQPGAFPGAIGGWLQLLRAGDILLVLGALLLIRLSSRLGMWAYAIVALPGTLAHELAHYLVATILLARPSFPSLVPQRTAHGWRLGSVAFRAGALRAVPIALAPLLLAPLALAWTLYWLAPASGLAVGLHAWIAGALLSASLPSSADFRIAFPALAVIAGLVTVAWLLLRFS